MMRSTPSFNPPAKIPSQEFRRDESVHDTVRDRIRKHALEAATHFDAHLAVVLRHQDEHAIVDALAAELPLVDDADRILLEGFVAGRGHDQHRDLTSLRLLECRKLVVKRLRISTREESSLIGYTR